MAIGLVAGWTAWRSGSPLAGTLLRDCLLSIDHSRPLPGGGELCGFPSVHSNACYLRAQSV